MITHNVVVLNFVVPSKAMVEKSRTKSYTNFPIS